LRRFLPLGAGAALVLAARFLAPTAPAIYDGIPPPAPPYNYLSPPPDLAAGNKPPSSGTKTLGATPNGNAVGTVETADQMLVVYFNEGTLAAPGATSFVVRLAPASDPPPPPAGSTMIGNDYRITALGEPGDLPVTQKGMAQVLLQVPPVIFADARLYHDGAWHLLPMTVETPRINVALDHLGDLAVFSTPGRPQQNGGFRVSVLQVVDAVVILAAIVAIVVTIVRRRRRGQV
jgi:hypothetical protein